jgi:hypothetical protein
MGREIISKSIVFNGVPTLSDIEGLIKAYITNPNIDVGWSQLGSVLLLMIRYVNSVAGGGGGLLTDGDYGDITISGGGTIISYNTNSVGNNDLAQMPSFTLKGNDTGVTANVKNLTVPETQIILSIDDLILLTGLVEGSVNLGAFSGVGLPVLTNLTIKQAFQALKDIIVLATTTVNGLMSASDFGKLAIQTLTDAATVTWNTNNGNYALLSITDNRTLAAPTNTVNGELYVINISASGADRTITFHSVYKGVDGTDIGAVVIPSGVARSYAFQAGPTVLHQIGSSSAPGGGGSQTTYDAGNGMIVTATAAGVTFARTNTTEWVVTIPNGVDIISGQIYSTTAQNPGANCYIAFNFGGTRPFNTNTAGTDARPPKHIWGVNMANNGDGTTPITRVNPQRYAVTTGATNLLPGVTAVANGDIEIEIQNYTTALGASASLVFFNF